MPMIRGEYRDDVVWMPKTTATMTMLRVTPSAPPTRPSTPPAATGSGVKKSLIEPKWMASRKPKRTNIMTATETSARPGSAAATHPRAVPLSACLMLGLRRSSGIGRTQ
jgi:hypothetical protein